MVILKLTNNIKSQQTFPKCLEPCNITSLFKNKGSRRDLNFFRGIFRVSVFRNILDRLIFNDEYENMFFRTKGGWLDWLWTRAEKSKSLIW